MREAVSSPRNRREAAASGAGFVWRGALFPSHQGTLRNTGRQIARLRNPLSGGISGRPTFAQTALNARANDGSANIFLMFSIEPGQCAARSNVSTRRTPAMGDQRKTLRLTRPDQFRPPGPPALESKEWAVAFNEIKRLAQRTPASGAQSKPRSRVRSDVSSTETPPGIGTPSRARWTAERISPSSKAPPFCHAQYGSR